MRKRDKYVDSITNLESSRDPLSGGIYLTFHAKELPERIYVHSYMPPFPTGVYLVSLTA